MWENAFRESCILKSTHKPKAINLAQPNFQFEKRQKELARKKKQEEKRQRKLEERNSKPNDNPVPPADEGAVA